MSNDSIARLEITELDKIGDLIDQRRSFILTNVPNVTSHVVSTIENRIESKGLKCRVYTSKRSAVLAVGLIPSGITQLTALGTAIGIGIHNLVTFNPDYEIIKYIKDNQVSVVYKK